MWDTYPNPTFQGTTLQRLQGLLGVNAFPIIPLFGLLAVGCKIYHLLYLDTVCTATQTSIIFLTKQSAWYPQWPPWQRLIFRYLSTHMVQMEMAAHAG